MYVVAECIPPHPLHSLPPPLFLCLDRVCVAHICVCNVPPSFLLLFHRAPDTAKIKNKMLITSTKADVRKKLVGIGLEIQATDFSEIDLEEVTNRCQSTTK
jgi:Cofilin/tropomyosin-type actin-binding protein